MNRIRKYNGVYQVLITPNIIMSPDSSLMLGNWEDEELRNFHIIEFSTLNEAQCEAYQYPDIDWYRIVLNHEYIFKRLSNQLNDILLENNFKADFIPRLMDPMTFKNTTFDRVMNGGDRFNLKNGLNDIISFIIVNPWTNNLHKIARQIETTRHHMYRDDIRIRKKIIVDEKTIYLYGVTEIGTLFEIILMPSLIYQWYQWNIEHGGDKHDYSNKLYQETLISQCKIDKGSVIR